MESVERFGVRHSGWGWLLIGLQTGEGSVFEVTSIAYYVETRHRQHRLARTPFENATRTLLALGSLGVASVLVYRLYHKFSWLEFLVLVTPL